MSAAESPSALLERAADALEAMGELAYNGPWRVDMLVSTCAIKTGEGSPYPGDHLANVGDRFTAAWIATMSPVVAGPLVELLRDAARGMRKQRRSSSDGTTYRLETGTTSTYQRSALAIARAVLGENTEEVRP